MIDTAIRDRLAETRAERSNMDPTTESEAIKGADASSPTDQLIDALYEAFGHMNVWEVGPVHRDTSVPAGETWLMITDRDMVEGMVCVRHAQEPVAHVNDYYDGLRPCLEESDLDHEFIESEGTYRVTLPTT